MQKCRPRTRADLARQLAPQTLPSFSQARRARPVARGPRSALSPSFSLAGGPPDSPSLARSEGSLSLKGGSPQSCGWVTQVPLGFPSWALVLGGHGADRTNGLVCGASATNRLVFALLTCVGYYGQESGFGRLRFDAGRPIKTRATTTTTITITVSPTIKTILEKGINPRQRRGEPHEQIYLLSVRNATLCFESAAILPRVSYAHPVDVDRTRISLAAPSAYFLN